MRLGSGDFLSLMKQIQQYSKKEYCCICFLDSFIFLSYAIT